MKIRMKYQVTGVTFTPHQIAQQSALDPKQMVPTGKAVQEIRLEALPFQEPSLPGEINPIPNNTATEGKLKFQILNVDALNLADNLLKPGNCVYIVIEDAPSPILPRQR